MAVPIFLWFSQGLASIARLVTLGSEPKVERVFMSANLYRHSKSGTVNVVDLTLPPTLDIDEFDRLNESILELIRGEPEGQWVLDLSQLSYMGSAALGLLVNLRQQIKQSGGRLVLCGLSPQLLQIFKTCCMEKLFRIVKSRKDAVAAAM
jgi:anti-sigma B factor antagonist